MKDLLIPYYIFQRDTVTRKTLLQQGKTGYSRSSKNRASSSQRNYLQRFATKRNYLQRFATILPKIPQSCRKFPKVAVNSPKRNEMFTFDDRNDFAKVAVNA
jgi:hypothetical protein